eukprot:Colp12_sorted_trinity150504_noHs@31618
MFGKALSRKNCCRGLRHLSTFRQQPKLIRGGYEDLKKGFVVKHTPNVRLVEFTKPGLALKTTREVRHHLNLWQHESDTSTHFVLLKTSKQHEDLLTDYRTPVAEDREKLLISQFNLAVTIGGFTRGMAVQWAGSQDSFQGFVTQFADTSIAGRKSSLSVTGPRYGLLNFNAKLLSVLYGNLGHFLAMTGIPINGSELYFAGIASHFIPEEREEELLRQLGGNTAYFADYLENTANECVGLPTGCPLARNIEEIRSTFDPTEVEGVVDALSSSNSLLAKKALHGMQQVAPLTLKVLNALLILCAELEPLDAVTLQRLVALRLLRHADFQAALHGKRKVGWTIDDLKNVTDAEVEAFFDDEKEGEINEEYVYESEFLSEKFNIPEGRNQ